MIEPDGYSPGVKYPMVIMLHGFGANMQDLAGLSPAIDPRGYVYAFPNAPLAFELGQGHVGYGWTPPRGEGTDDDVKRAEELLEVFFDRVIEQYNVTPGRVLLAGFSQGGIMTYRCGLERPDLFAGLAVLSASLPDPVQLKARLPSERKQPIFIAHGVHDQMLPVAPAREAAAFLEGEGYTVKYREYQMGHEINQQVMDDLVPWIKETLPPASA